MSAWTKGPWKKAEPVPERHAIRILGADGGLVAEARGASGPWTQVTCNARLIAACPDLYDALERLVEIERRDNLTDPDKAATDEYRACAWEEARALLAALDAEEGHNAD